MVTTTGFIRCLCKHKYGDNSNCPRHGSLMSRTSPPPSSPSYTLAELNGLAREFITEQEHQGHYPTNLQLVLSLFLQWMAKAKREQGEVRGR